MARGSAGKIGGTSRVRFVMMEAEIADGGDLAQFTQAIQNALRGPAPTTVVKRIAASPLQVNGGDEVGEPEVVDETATEGLEVAAPPPAAPRQPRAKRTVGKMPTVIDIDMHADVSFAAFAKGKDAESQHKKYLIAAAWLAEHRGTPAVNERHIFTCFKSIGWALNVSDWGQPFRELKNKRRFFEKTESGYEINHLGLDYVNKLNAGGGE